MVTISECGSIPDPDNLVKDGAAWSYFMPWYGDFVKDSKYNSLDLWKKLFASDYVLTLNEMPNLSTYITPDINTGSNSKPDNKAFRAYPTYFGESFNIQSGDLIKTISVYNRIGVRIKTFNPEANNTSISLKGYPSGMYLVKADDIAAVKVIKK
jgi:mannan endo-1,4-beta-mannosidase